MSDHDQDSDELREQYERACRLATTHQGLTPVVERFKQEGIPLVVDQTGGFTMVARVQSTGDDFLGITAADKDNFILCGYNDEGASWRVDEFATEGFLIGVGNLDYLVQSAQAFLAGRQP